MSTIENPYLERRRSIRICPKGSVVLLAGDRVEHGRLANISSGGLLAISAERPAESMRGADVNVELRLDSSSSEWLQLTGRVLRIDGFALALAFANASESFGRLMQDSLSASSEHERVRTAVLIDAVPERCGPLAEAFMAAGFVVLEVSTPLEAVVRLCELQFEPDLIAISDSLPRSLADDLRDFAESEHPSAKLVAIGDELLAPLSPTDRPPSADWQAQLITRIRALLNR